MKCPKCGNNAPDGSAFCNQCGTPLNTDVQCPSCGATIPANSVFCPKCGKMVKNDMEQQETFNERQARLRREAEQQREAERARQEAARAQAQARELEAAKQESARQSQQCEQEEAARREAQRREALKQPAQWNEDNANDDDDDDDDTATSNFNRNLVIGIGIVVALIVILMVLRNCGSSDNSDKAVPVNDSISATTIDGQDPLAVFNNEMGRSNFVGDGTQTAFAQLFPASEGKQARIVGVTYLNDGEGAIYKIYQMKQNGSSWDIERLDQVSLAGRKIAFENAALMVQDGITPRAVQVDGKDCLYFAYKNTPTGSTTMGRVSLVLYDLEAKVRTSIDYDGPVKTRDDGRKYIYGKPLQGDNSSAARFLRQEAASIKLIYFPTEEEIRAEEERLAEEEAQKELEAPENADAKWDADNAENMNNTQNGGEVKMQPQSYDKPIFKMEDKHASINNANYTVFSDKNGGVYGFNKATRKYFVIYKGGSGAPTEIGFADSENNILNFTTSSGEKYQYNLKTDAMKRR